MSDASPLEPKTSRAGEWTHDGLVVSVDDAEEYARQAVLADRAKLDPLLEQCRKIAEWHGNDSDECGTLARSVMEQIDAIRAKGDT